MTGLPLACSSSRSASARSCVLEGMICPGPESLLGLPWVVLRAVVAAAEAAATSLASVFLRELGQMTVTPLRSSCCKSCRAWASCNSTSSQAPPWLRATLGKECVSTAELAWLLEDALRPASGAQGREAQQLLVVFLNLFTSGRIAVASICLLLLSFSWPLPEAPRAATIAVVTLIMASLVPLLGPFSHSVSVVPASDPIRSWSRLNSEPLGIATSFPLAQLRVSAPFLKQDAICPHWLQKTRPPALYSLCDCQRSCAAQRGIDWAPSVRCRRVPRAGNDLIHSACATAMFFLLRFRLAAASAALLRRLAWIWDTVPTTCSASSSSSCVAALLPSGALLP